MLNNHPELVLPPECGFAEWMYEEFSGKRMNDNTYREFLVKAFQSRKFETWGLNYDDVVESIMMNKPKNYQELVFEIYKSYASKVGKAPALIGDKNNYYINHTEKLEKMFPGCKKIFIIRDGRDVACSYLELNSKAIESKYKPELKASIEEIAEEWSHSVSTTMFWVQRGARYIKYEDLVSEPVPTLKFVCDFLGIVYSENMLKYFNNNDEPEEFKSWKGKISGPVDNASVGRYKSDLSLNDLDYFESLAGSSLLLAGYKV
jgi:hypothetical protein